MSTLPRTVAAETLDALSPDDPVAARSRRDLRRIHRAMATCLLLRRRLRDLRPPAGRPLRVLELGAGDGTLMLRVARAWGPRRPAVRLTLLDRAPAVEPGTLADYASVGWAARVIARDALDWAANERTPAHGPQAWDAIVTTLFLHHFERPALRELLAGCAASCARLVAIEPRRSRLALAASRLVGALGANAVTRGDAVLSVHAGFVGREIRQAWPHGADAWTIDEGPAGPFSHAFVAVRR